jgi:predicted RNase H-like HicB family nuclease
MELAVKITGCSGGYYRAWCPALPGCAVYGHTRTQVRSKIQDAVTGYVANMGVALPRELGRNLTKRLIVADFRPPQEDNWRLSA